MSSLTLFEYEAAVKAGRGRHFEDAQVTPDTPLHVPKLTLKCMRREFKGYTKILEVVLTFT